MHIKSMIVAGFLLFFSCNLWSDIVKWVDENGKVHYGDRVPDKYKNKAEDVKIDTSNFVDNEHKPSASLREKRLREKELAAKKTKEEEYAQQQARLELEIYCKKAESYYKDISTFEHSGDGGYSVTVLRDESGKMMSRSQQDQKAERFRKEANNRGCNISQSKGLRLR